MAQHTGGAKMSKVEKKIEKEAPHGVTHHGHSGGAKMSEVEKKIEKSKEPKKSWKNLFGLLSVMVLALALCVSMAACTSSTQDIPTYTTTQLAQKYETDDPTDLKGMKMYLVGEIYESEDNLLTKDYFTLVPIDSDGDGYGVTFKMMDATKKARKAVKKADMTDEITVLCTVTKVTKSGYVFDVDQIVEIVD